MIIAAGVVALLTFARDQEWWPYHADTHIELTAPDTNITIGDSDLAVYIRGTLPDPQEHIWVVATDERNRWYPLTEAFRDARNGRWSSVIRPTELGAPAGTHLALHAVIADSAASNALYAAVGNPQTSKVGLDHLPTGANSVDHVEVVR